MTAVIRTLDDAAALGTVLGVWAHPDDETRRTGSSLAAIAAGMPVLWVLAWGAGR